MTVECPGCNSTVLRNENRLIFADTGYMAAHWVEEVWQCPGCGAAYDSLPVKPLPLTPSEPASALA